MSKDKNKIIETLKINPKDVGSSEVQIGLLSDKIDNLSNDFQKNKNDKHSTQGLLKAVNLRKRLFLSQVNFLIGDILKNRQIFTFLH